MAPPGRLLASSAHAASRAHSTPVYICQRCQFRSLVTGRRGKILRSSAPSLQPRRFASNDDFENTFAGRLRKRLWGTDTPPGQRNPYVKETAEEREERELDEQEEELIQREQEEIRALRSSREESEVGADVPGAVVQEGEIAEVEEEEPPAEYKAATTWRRLRNIPDFESAQKIVIPSFNGFLPAVQKTSHGEIASAIERALTEILTLKQMGQTLRTPRFVRELSDAVTVHLSRNISFQRNESGDYQIEYNDQNLRDEVLRSLGRTASGEPSGEEEVEHVPQAQESQIEGFQYTENTWASQQSATAGVVNEVAAEEQPALGEEMPPARDRSWQRVLIADPDVKFAIVRRVMQLTGLRVPDSALSHITTARDLLTTLSKPQKPPKLGATLLKKGDLVSLPNVHVEGKRWTTVKKERELGRWKLIKEELIKKDLPVDMRKVRQSRNRVS